MGCPAQVEPSVVERIAGTYKNSAKVVVPTEKQSVALTQDTAWRPLVMLVAVTVSETQVDPSVVAMTAGITLEEVAASPTAVQCVVSTHEMLRSNPREEGAD
jgi:hypothetical protein